MHRTRAALYIIVVILATWTAHWLTTTPGESAQTPGIPVGMFVPALVAIIFRYLDRESPLHPGNIERTTALLLGSFVLLFALCLGLQVAASRMPAARSSLVGVGNVLQILWVLLLIQLLKRGSGGTLSRLRLGVGRADVGVWLVIGYVFFLLLQSGLNLSLGLGDFRGIQPLPIGLSLSGPLYAIAVLLLFLLAVVGTPLASMAVMFGEEYGWRGFLQDELSPGGRRRAALVVGVVWWFWHFPIILSGIHTYPPEVRGFAMALVFFVLWGFVQSYAVLKTGSILAAAFLHGVVNSVYSFGLIYLVRPDDKLAAFGLGWPGLVCLAAIVLVILRDPVWTGGRSEHRDGPPS